MIFQRPRGNAAGVESVAHSGLVIPLTINTTAESGYASRVKAQVGSSGFAAGRVRLVAAVQTLVPTCGTQRGSLIVPRCLWMALSLI